MVLGHSVTGGIVWPRFDQRVIANDTGIGSHYGSHKDRQLLLMRYRYALTISGNLLPALPRKNYLRQ